MENYIIRQEWNNADITANWNWNVWRQYKWNQKCELKIKSNTFSEQWWKHNMDFKNMMLQDNTCECFVSTIKC